jgi:DNA-3-methyladenine glycosylase II
MRPSTEPAASLRRREAKQDRVTVSLRPRAPFRLDATAWALRRRPDNAIDRWDGNAYSRTFAVPGGPVEVAVRETGTPLRPRLEIEIAIASRGAGPKVAPVVLRMLRRMLGTDVDLGGFYALAAKDPLLAPLAERFRGIKPPCFPTVFETLVNAVACQQLSLAVGIRLLGRLAGLGEHTARAEREPKAVAFPTPQEVAAIRTTSLRHAGFSRQKSAAILAIAREAATGRLDPERFSALDDAAATDRLLELPGIGRWSAEYVLLRGLGRWHIFPGDDVGARNHLQRWLGLRRSLDYESVRRIVRRWHPYAGLVYFHLLLKHLGEEGRLA